MKDVQLSKEFPLIVANRDRLGGKPCIKDTRISVAILLELAGQGADVAEILAGYPFLTEEAVQQAFLFAAHAMSEPAIELSLSVR